MPRDAHLIPCLLLTLSPVLLTTAYDAYSACSKPFRTSKFYAEPPCDFRVQPWCTVPGSAYPWQAVRRFVRENQGLMRRMYGDERHISVLRAEIESNDVEYLTETEWKLREQVRLRYSSRTPSSASSSTEPPATTAPTAGERTTSTVPITTWRRPAESTSTSTSTSAPTSTSGPPNTTQHALELRNMSSNSSLAGEEPNPPQHALELRTISPNSSLAEEEPNTTTSYEAAGNSTDPAFPTTLAETTVADEVLGGGDTTEGEDADDEQGTTEETTESARVTEEMTTMKESELFQAVRDPVEVAEKTPPLLKLKGVNACPVKEEVVAPFWANNTRGEILALLNVYPFEQYVHWEKCTYENKQMFCRNGCRCEQQYRLHRLLAYDPSNECRGIFSDWFKFPSCCVCRCYDLPIEFHITSRSPRVHNNEPPYWYKLKPFG